MLDARWQIDWLDVPPGDLLWHEPLVRVERSDDGASWALAADDQGCSLQVVHVGDEGPTGHRYRAMWWSPAFRAGRRHRFVLPANGRQPEVASEPFD